jgi:hypothetical protein
MERIYLIYYSDEGHCFEFYTYINEDSDLYDIEDFNKGYYKLTFINGNVGIYNFIEDEFYIKPDYEIEDIEGNYAELTILYKNGNKETITQDITHPVYENKIHRVLKENINKVLNDRIDNIVRESLSETIKEFIKQKDRKNKKR